MTGLAKVWAKTFLFSFLVFLVADVATWLLLSWPLGPGNIIEAAWFTALGAVLHEVDYQERAA